MFFLFFILIVGPVICQKVGVFDSLSETIPSTKDLMYLLQPTGLNNNDTTNKETGHNLPGADSTASGGAGGAASSSAAGGGGFDNPFGSAKVRRAMPTFVYDM